MWAAGFTTNKIVATVVKDSGVIVVSRIGAASIVTRKGTVVVSISWTVVVASI